MREVATSTAADIGARVWRYRTRRSRRLTQDQLADLIGRSVRWIRMLEAGQVDPHLSEVRNLADALEISVTALVEGEPVAVPAWVRPTSGWLDGLTQGVDGMNRRTFLQRAAAGVGATSLAVPGWDRLTRALEGSIRVDETLISHLGSLTAHMERLAPQLGHRALLPPAMGHLAAITNLLDRGMTPRLRERLHSIAGESAAMTGQLLWYQGAHRESGEHFHLALRMAADADDRALGTFVLGRIAIHGFEPADRIRLLSEGGFGFHPRDASPTTRVWLAWIQADSASIVGRAGLVEQQYDLIRGLFDRHPGADADRDRPRVPLYLRSDVSGDLGGSLARLGRTDDARAELKSAIAALDPTNQTQRAWLLVAEATTYVNEEPSEAARLAMKALVLARHLDAQPIERDIQLLAGRLESYAAEPAVADLREQLSGRL